MADPALLAERLAREIPDEKYEAKIAGLLKRAYEQDVNSDRRARELYRKATAILRR